MEDIKRIVEELNKKNRKLNLQILVGIEADEFLKNEKLSTFTRISGESPGL